MSKNYKLVERWAQINAELASNWEKMYHLVEERDKIEATETWLRGKGATPFPPKKEEQREGGKTMILDTPEKKKQKTKSKTQKSIEGLPIFSLSSPPPPDPTALDVSQNFNKN